MFVAILMLLRVLYASVVRSDAMPPRRTNAFVSLPDSALCATPATCSVKFRYVTECIAAGLSVVGCQAINRLRGEFDCVMVRGPRPKRQSSADVRHLVRHTGPRQSICLLCSTTGTTSNIYQHVRNVHASEVGRSADVSSRYPGFKDIVDFSSPASLIALIVSVALVPIALLFTPLLRPIWLALGVLMPCGNTVYAHIDKMEAKITARREEQLAAARVIHVTLDVWSKRGRSVLGVLATVVNPDFTTHIVPIGFVDAPRGTPPPPPTPPPTSSPNRRERRRHPHRPPQ